MYHGVGFLFIDIEILVPAIILFCFTFLLTFFVFLLVWFSYCRPARSTLTVHNTDQLWVCHAFTRRKRAIMWARLLLIGMWGSFRSQSRPGKIKEGERGESAVTSANRFVIRCPQPVRVGSRAMQVVILVPLTGIRCHRWITDLTRQRTSSLRIPTSHQTDTCRYLKGSLLICTKSSLHDWSEHIRALKLVCCK